MTCATGQRPFISVRFKGPDVKAFGEWFPTNRSFYECFRRWLRAGGYGESALNQYSVAARLALGFLDIAYWRIDPDADLARVRAYIAAHYSSASTRSSYLKGLAKFEEYLRFRCHHPKSEKRVNWHYYLGSLPEWLAQHVRDYITHCQRAWLPERRYAATGDLLSHTTLFLRWAVTHVTLHGIDDLTPALWFDYVDERLAAGIKPVTLNGELRALHAFLHFLSELNFPVCPRTLKIDILKEGAHLPRDVPPVQLRRLLDAIETDAASTHAGIHRMGVMDRAWFLLMLHTGLRAGEVRRLKRPDLDLNGRRVRIEQSKGLKDRIVYLSPATVTALQAYLELRGPMNTEHVFTFRHQPLSESYCYERLRTYGGRCGVRVTPHQLRHSCATLLLNAGAPVLTVQTLLGHKPIDTTLGYARLYDGTIAADYYRAMNEIEQRLALQNLPDAPPPTGGQVLALVDALRDGTLNDRQQATVHALRAAILGLLEQQPEAG